MLDSAFFESPDYRTLIESGGKHVVVGRRGAGKSALVYKLQSRFRESGDDLVLLAPEEDQVIGLRALAPLFGQTFAKQRAGSRIAWRYALTMEIAATLCGNYRFRKATGWAAIREVVNDWRTLGSSFAERLRRALGKIAIETEDPETRIGELASRLKVEQITTLLGTAIAETRRRCTLLLDRLDEGYEPDLPGIGLIDGLVLAGLALNDQIPGVTAIVFLRDNIFRTVARWDPDYSRDIEGQVLRLHWDEAQLLTLVSKRLRVAFGLTQENDLRVWNACTGRGLTERAGFRKCLQFTLYRPRDVILLLNQAFLAAARDGRREIVDSDIEATAKYISVARLNDLEKEYSAVSPSIKLAGEVFANGKAEYSVAEAEVLIGDLEERTRAGDTALAQELTILESARNVLRELYSVGFVGIRDPATSNFVFCHDGSLRDRELGGGDRLLIHPCYWMGLNLARNQLQPEEAAEINDEYDIEVRSATPRLRAARLGDLIAKLGTVAIGPEEWSAFEEWCLNALRIVFAKALDNIVLHPNPVALQRRDIVGTNMGQTGAWRRIREDYGVRQVVFEAKNMTAVGSDEFRQMVTYLSGDYGRLGFVITRDDDEKPRRGEEMQWIREVYFTKQILIVKLTGKWLSSLLGKLRNPQKHDAVEKRLNYLLDQYSRSYLPTPAAVKEREAVGERRKDRKRERKELGS